MLTDHTTMVAIFAALIHLVLVAAALCQLLLIATVVAKFNRSTPEMIMRSAAAVAGVLLYLGAKAMGLSIPAFLLQALTQSGSYLTGLAGAMLPAAVGFLCAWYVTRYFNNRNERKNLIGMRVLAMLMTVVFFLFVDTYVAAFGAAHDAGFNLLLPNLTFTLAVLLYAVFRYHPLPDAADTLPADQAARIIEAVRATEKAAS
jgi:hypothetical protein